MSQHHAAASSSEPLIPPSPRPPPNDNELATVREAQRQQCVRSPILDMVLRFITPRSPDDDHHSPSSSTSSDNNGTSTRRFRVLSPTYPMHVRTTKDGKKRRFRYPDNSVSTAKYNIFTFLPRALFEQFRRLANIYFLVVTVLMLIGTYSDLYESPLTPFTTLFPLIVVLTVTMGKEAFEDLKRHTADQNTNNRAAHVLRLAPTSASSNGEGELEEVFWKNIGVGRIVKVLDKEEIPADMILLTSSEPGGNCCIETSNIDGETNLKIKEAARTGENGCGPAFVTISDLKGWEAAVECEAPNSRIHTYTGTLLLTPKDKDRNQEQQQRRLGVNQANLLLRGSRLRNTKWVLGLVVYTGYDTKIVMNSRAAPSKLSTIEVTTNRLLYLILGMQILLVTVTLGAYLVWTDANESQLHYLCMDYLNGPSAILRMNCQATSKEASELGMWVTFLLLYNNFVPISLYVTVEMVNYIQAYYIDQDLSMYDPSSETPALARTSNMNGDLGSVRYVFSDKTGTLTRNVMEFRRCSVGGVIYGNLEEGGREEEGGEGRVEGQQIRGEEERTSGGSAGSGGRREGASGRPWPFSPLDPFVLRGKALQELAELSDSCEGKGGEKRISKTAASDSAAATGAFYFAECLAVCHTVVVEKPAPSSPAATALLSSFSSSSRSPSRGGGDRDNTAAAATTTPSSTPNPTPPSYQAESPDEEALVDAAARQLHWSFLARTPTSALILNPQNQQLTYQVLAVIPFTSTRKRMSVIVRTPENKIVLLTKGADNVIFERATSYLGTTRQALDAHLSVFAADGLRTLVLARKEIEEDDFKSWLVEFQNASTAVKGRSERLAEIGEKVERELVVIGATAIEDKLQEGVPDTIAHLLEAGIKVWVLTGDKVETAINIAYSCRLLHAKMTLIKVIDPKDEGGGRREEAECDAALRQQLRKLVTHFEQLVEDEALVGGLWASSRSDHGEGDWKGWLPWRWWRGRSGSQGGRKRRRRRRSTALSFTTVPAESNRGAGRGGRGEGVATGMLSEPLVGDDADEDDDMPSSSHISKNPLKDVQSDHLALIIDGPALARVFGDWEMERLLLRVATLCKSVVACRVSPAQKRMLIRLVKKGVKHPTPITLAIGDGANDVAMIQEAQVGVGISGREGRQAVNSADFAIAQFRFLEPLLVKHGRWSYRRTSKVILYSFYKNIVLTFVLFAYTWLTGFSGQSLLEDYVYTSYNFMLAMPPICFGLFDRDLSVDTIMGTATPDAQHSSKRTQQASSTTTIDHPAASTAKSRFDDNAAATTAATASSFRWAYMSGRDNLDLNLGQMALWLLQAILDSILIFGFSFGAMSAPCQVLSSEGDVDDLYMLGLITFTGMLVGMLYKAATNTFTWTWVNFFFFFGSALLFLIFLAIYGSLPIMAGGFYGVPGRMVRHPSFWLVGVVLVPTVSVVVDYIFIYLRLSFFPSPVDIAVEYDRGYFIPKAAIGTETAPATAARVARRGGRARTFEEEEAARGGHVPLQGTEAAQAEEEAMERRRSGWYPGKLLVSLPLLRRLNSRISQRDKKEMGLSEAEGGLMPSSYDYTSSSFDLGPGAGCHGESGGGKVLARRHSRG